MYLVDTNIWLERLLDQEKSEIVGKFLDIVPSEKLFISDFAFHSIGVILCRIGKRDALKQFTDDIFKNGEVSLLNLVPDDILIIKWFANFRQGRPRRVAPTDHCSTVGAGLRACPETA